MPIREIELEGLRALRVDRHTPAHSIVVMLHGYAMRPEDLSPFALSMRTQSVFYFPQGPVRADPQGFAWWPIDQENRRRQLQLGPRDLSDEYPADRASMRSRLRAFIESVKRCHPGLPVVLAGFSQGGMLSCDLMLLEDIDIAALALMSTSQIALGEWTPRLERARDLRVFISHGRDDPDLAFAAGERLCRSLEDAGARVTWTPFDGRHEIPLLVWRRLRDFLGAV